MESLWRPAFASLGLAALIWLSVLSVSGTPASMRGIYYGYGQPRVVTICHVTRNIERTLQLPQAGADAHLSQHAADHGGSCG